MAEDTVLTAKSAVELFTNGIISQAEARKMIGMSLTPDGETFNQKIANSYSLKKNLILLCGHYKGIDQRIRDLHITREISIGDFVLTGGELAACVVADAIIRLLPGVLNDETSALTGENV